MGLIKKKARGLFIRSMTVRVTAAMVAITMAVLMCVAIVVVTCATMMPTDAYATEIVASGTAGVSFTETELKWRLDSGGILTISGKGIITGTDFKKYGWITLPWETYADKIKEIVIVNCNNKLHIDNKIIRRA